MASNTGDQLPGFKIFESPHKERVMGMLLLKRGNKHCSNWLAAHGMPNVNYRTIRAFEKNYMGNIQQDVADRIKAAILTEEAKEEGDIAASVVAGKLTTAQTYKNAIEQTQKQINTLQEKKVLDDDQQKLLRGYYRDLIDWRCALEIHDKESEVENTRRTVLRDVVKIALTVMKGDEGKQDEFIKRIAEYAKGN